MSPRSRQQGMALLILVATLFSAAALLLTDISTGHRDLLAAHRQMLAALAEAGESLCGYWKSAGALPPPATLIYLPARTLNMPGTDTAGTLPDGLGGWVFYRTLAANSFEVCSNSALASVSGLPPAANCATAPVKLQRICI